MLVRLTGLLATVILLLCALGLATASNASTLTVTTNADNGIGSLRAQIIAASAGDTITFDPSLNGDTILLASGLPTIDKSLAIMGPGSSLLAIDGNANQYQPFLIAAPGGNVVISGLTIQNGHATNGGGISANGTGLSVTGCVINNCTASQDGGGIACNFGTFLLANCTLSNNTAVDGGAVLTTSSSDTFVGCTVNGNSATDGGGFSIITGTATATNCTFSGNAATFAEGAFYCHSATCTLTNCTFHGNTAIGEGGAVGNQTGTVTLKNCILYGDSSPNGNEVDSKASTVSASYCDIGGGVSGAITDGGNNIATDPLLGALQNNLGSTSTLALGGGSPCYGAGTSPGAPAIDQRGIGRPSPPSIGAYDFGTPLGTTTAPTITPAGGVVTLGDTAAISDTQSPCTIFDTTDGSIPSPGLGSASQYSGPVTLNGNQTVTAVAVSPGYYVSAPTAASFIVVDHFIVTGADPVEAAGVPFTLTVTPADAGNNAVAGYTPTSSYVKQLESQDDAAILAPITWVNGVGTFTATFTIPTFEQSIDVIDGNNVISGWSYPFTVVSGPATHFSVNAPSTAIKTASFPFTVTALDAYGDVADSYTGTVHITSSDPLAVLPADVTLNNGVGVMNATVNTFGAQTVTATDTVNLSITGTSDPIQVGAGHAVACVVTAPSSTAAGSPVAVTVTMLDHYGNTAIGYSGTLRFNSTDPAASLPANSTLTNGVGTFSATLVTAGSRTIGAADTLTPSLSGVSGSITVSPIAASHFKVNAPANAVSGTPVAFIVTAQDLYNNKATGYEGVAQFTSTDSAAVLPANSTLVAGAGTFSATLFTAGSQTITATDTVTSSITGTSGPVAVVAGPATRFVVTGPASSQDNTSFNVTITAEDAAGNVATSYNGIANVTVTGFAGSVLSNVRLTHGTVTVHLRLTKVGSHTITATDIAASSITGTSAPIVVSGGPATHFAVAAPSSATAGTPFSFTVTALDQYDNAASGYIGTVAFSCTDSLAVLSSSTLLGGADSFSVTLYTIGDQSITVTDSANPLVHGASGAINVGVDGVHTFPAGLAMISAPADYSGQPLANVLGYASPRLAAWDPSLSVYDVTPTAPADGLRTGHGYWIRFPADETVTGAGVATPTGAPFTIELFPGWNMIGDPFPSGVPLSTLSVIDSNSMPHSFADALSSGIVHDPLYTFQHGDANYEIVTAASGSLIPYYGYWLYASQSCTLSIPAP